MNSSVFDAETVRALAAILADTGLSEIEVTDGEQRIRLSRAVPAAAAPAPAAPIAAAPAPAASAPPESAASVPAPEADHPGTLTSPMVGIAYLSPEPGAAPYVTQGAAVTAGQTVLLIEAMKTFNQIKAPRAGTLSRILINAGVPVEYGEVLMVID